MHQEIEQERNNGLSRDEAVAESENTKANEHSRQEALPSVGAEEVHVRKVDKALREEHAAIQIQRAFRNHLVIFSICKGII